MIRQSPPSHTRTAVALEPSAPVDGRSLVARAEATDPPPGVRTADIAESDRAHTAGTRRDR
ncbi:hypothetical protein [Halomicrobium katesii]|uniref:hypothetical protein n=1 Tax=Halomicrobium katesii TaxID=437163 RepID=UPI00036D9289|nr:hypothetical protein [Halomicrobium katesii]